MIKSTPKMRKKPGPPPKGHKKILVSVPPSELADLDTWIKQQSDKPSRPQAIRRLMEQALALPKNRR
jgi:hypothetical protein